MEKRDRWSNLRRGGLLTLSAAIGLASACGGRAVEERSGTAGAAPAVGGALSFAGANSAAGGSSSVAGAPSPAAGVPGAGGAATGACTARRESGTCDAAIPAFWHDPKTGLCEFFVYGGCGGNDNRYPSRDTCLQACPNLGDDWDQCANDNDCTFVSQSCCGQCEPAVIERFTTVNRAHQAAYEKANCPDAPPCVPCPPVLENKQTQKYFKPACRNAHCTLIDIRETALTACQKTSDCMLRDGAECCPQCDGTGWVAVNRNADLCGGVPMGCDDCVSKPPPEWDFVCLSGRCFQEGPL